MEEGRLLGKICRGKGCTINDVNDFWFNHSASFLPDLAV